MDLRELKGRLGRAYAAFNRSDPLEAHGGFLSVEQRAEDAPFLTITPELVARWNQEWLRYLGNEWDVQLVPYSDRPGKPALPDDPRALLELRIPGTTPLSLYCDREWIEGKRLVEIGCGCGNLGKLIARWTESYLGVDYSTLALAIARLVSPPNATYLHASDREGLRASFGKIDTAVGRFFWIHQNLETGRRVLELLAALLVPGGRVYADFFAENPAKVYGIPPLPARGALSSRYPSSLFKYGDEDLRALLAGTPFRVLREEHMPAIERRFVVLEKS